MSECECVCVREREIEIEREDCIKSLRIFDLRCNHFINFNIFYFYFVRGLGLYFPLVNTLNIFFVTNSVNFPRLYNY